MQKILSYVWKLVGNGKAATIGIFLFIALLIFFLYRPAHGAEVDLTVGSSFGSEGYGPVLGFDVRQPLSPNKGLNLYAGTDLWGNTTHAGQTVPNNWDWHGGIESCRWRFCARIGAVYVQRIDAINGAHTNFNLGLLFHATDRWNILLSHISDAGTSDPNVGRQVIAAYYKLQ